jgi:hypothetical protein
MGNILHDWGLKEKKLLLKKAFDALPDNGVLITVEAIIDPERKTNMEALLTSLHMLVET